MTWCSDDHGMSDTATQLLLAERITRLEAQAELTTRSLNLVLGAMDAPLDPGAAVAAFLD